MAPGTSVEHAHRTAPAVGVTVGIPLSERAHFSGISDPDSGTSGNPNNGAYFVRQGASGEPPTRPCDLFGSVPSRLRRLLLPGRQPLGHVLFQNQPEVQLPKQGYTLRDRPLVSLNQPRLGCSQGRGLPAGFVLPRSDHECNALSGPGRSPSAPGTPRWSGGSVLVAPLEPGISRSRTGAREPCRQLVTVADRLHQIACGIAQTGWPTFPTSQSTASIRSSISVTVRVANSSSATSGWTPCSISLAFNGPLRFGGGGADLRSEPLRK